jgi:hypothetical protein
MQRLADHAVLRALFAPVAAGTAHHLIVEDLCTVVVVGPERRLEAAEPSVVDRLLRLQENAHDADSATFAATFAVVLRSYTGMQVVYSPGSEGILAQQIRGWIVTGGEWRPVSAAQLFNAMCTDPETEEPIPPEPAAEYLDAWPVALP